jgi:hypothetical protein
MIHGDAYFAYFNKIWGIPQAFRLGVTFFYLGVTFFELAFSALDNSKQGNVANINCLNSLRAFCPKNR